MTRALVHIGLAVALVVAPTLCCCKARGLVAAAHAAAPHTPQTPNPVHSCCEKAVTSCCHEESDPPVRSDAPAPAPQPAPECACCVERPTAAQTESQPVIAAAEPTGELQPLPHFVPAAALEHRGHSRGAYPPDVGSDAKSAALLDRHVMRC